MPKGARPPDKLKTSSPKAHTDAPGPLKPPDEIKNIKVRPQKPQRTRFKKGGS